MQDGEDPSPPAAGHIYRVAEEAVRTVVCSCACVCTCWVGTVCGGSLGESSWNSKINYLVYLSSVAWWADLDSCSVAWWVQALRWYPNAVRLTVIAGDTGTWS